jgi:RNA polymerase sigma-70 factor (ECF subfamily)
VDAKMMMENRGMSSDETRPIPQPLLLALKGYENTVYNLCFQVLRQPEDAEDAAQKVFLELLENLHRIADEDHLRRWIRRASLHVALDVKRRRRTRMAYERAKAARACDIARPPSEDTSDAIYRAILALDDDARTIVVDHYFEQRSLETIARERGCSRVSLWKRLTKAKERMRAFLARSGLAEAVPCVDPLLEGVVSVRASRSLLPTGVSSKSSAAAAAWPPKPLASGVIKAWSAKSFPFLTAAVVAATLVCGYATARVREAGRPQAEQAARRSGGTEPGKSGPAQLLPPSPSSGPASRNSLPSERIVLAAQAPPPGPSEAAKDRELKGHLGALRWLMSVQNADGSWGAASASLSGHSIDRVGISALSLLSFLGAGYSTQSRDSLSGFRTDEAVEKALGWLAAAQREDGSFPTRGDPALSQALTTLALCEHYGMKPTPVAKESISRSLKILEGLQKPDGSWGDVFQSLWAALALKSAQLDEFPLDKAKFTLAQNYFKSRLDSGADLPGMIGHVFLNGDMKHPAVEKTSSWVAVTPPDLRQQDFAYWYMGSMALYQNDGPKEIWRVWGEGLRNTLLSSQDKDGRWPGAAMDLTLMQTSLGCLSLEVFYGHANVVNSRK